MGHMRCVCRRISVLGANGTSWSAGGDAGAPSCKRIPSARCVCSAASSPAPWSLITWCLIAATGTRSSLVSYSRYARPVTTAARSCWTIAVIFWMSPRMVGQQTRGTQLTNTRHTTGETQGPGGRRRKFYSSLSAARRPFHVESCEIAICTGILFPKSCSSQSFRSAESGDAHRLPQEDRGLGFPAGQPGPRPFNTRGMGRARVSGNETDMNQQQLAAPPAWPADQVERRSLASLLPAARNARTHLDAQVDQIAASIQQWGWTMPVLADEAGSVIAGHGRIAAAARLGLAEVPVITARGWSEAQKRAYLIADNKLTDNGGWDRALLKLEMAELGALGFDLLLTGFSGDELTAMSMSHGGLTDPDSAPALEAAAIAQPGELWQLGKHRLVCGDATSVSDVALCLGGVQPQLMVTDPPYGVNYDPAWRARAGVNLNLNKLGTSPTTRRLIGAKPGRCFRARSPTAGMPAASPPPCRPRSRPPASRCARRSFGRRIALRSRAAIITGSTSPA